MRESEPNLKNELIHPFSFHINDEIGGFYVVENPSGLISIEVVNKEGKRVILNDLLPDGYEVVGKIRILKDINRFGLGLAETDTSIADIENKAIIVSEKEVKSDGRRYILTFLHEVGHIMRHQERPELRERRNSADKYSVRNPENVEAFKRVEALIAADERDAWAFAFANI